MRTSILVATALVTSGWLAACSKPAGEGDSEAAANARDIQLVGSSATEATLVSDLEAGRSTRRAEPRLIQRKPPTVAAKADRLVAAAEFDRLTPTVAPDAPVATLAEAPAAAAEEPAPEIIRAPLPQSWGGGGPVAGDFGRGGFGGGGPVIIIRGGRGGIDDDCDLHRRPGFGGRRGIAINERAPFPGGIRLNPTNSGSGPIGTTAVPRGRIH